MTEQIRSDIICYTEMLQNTYGLSITMHPTDAVLTASFSSLFRYNFHKAPLCLYCKQNKALRKRCVRTQKLIEAKCKNGSHRCFYGVCHAGIGCYVFPVMSGSRFLGYICVNGVKADTSLSSRRLKGIAKHAADLTKDQLEHLYEKSLLSVPDKALLETLILPLPHMLCQLHRELEALMEKSAHIPNLDLNMKVMNFLYQNSTKQVTVDSIAEHVYFIRSFISHMFKKSNGMSISEYLHRIRLENAEALLATSDLTISAIATEVGFGDANYFSKVFKRKHGISPRAYRQEKIAQRKNADPK